MDVVDGFDQFFSQASLGTGESSSPHAAPGDDRRQAIIAAAYHLIVEKGFAGFRIRDAAERAGITAATLYYYFPTKEALVQAVDGYLTQLILQHQLEWAGDPSASPREQLHAHLAGIQHLLQHDRSIFVALHELYLRSLRDTSVNEILEAGEVGWRSYLASILDAGRQQQQFRGDLDPINAAWVIMSFIKGIQLDMPIEALDGAIHELEAWLLH
ncbi:MAG: TetR/AcrR family transcriptional regulator [Ktedonobacterales bacterium]